MHAVFHSPFFFVVYTDEYDEACKGRKLWKDELNISIQSTVCDTNDTHQYQPLIKLIPLVVSPKMCVVPDDDMESVSCWI